MDIFALRAQFARRLEVLQIWREKCQTDGRPSLVVAGI